MSYSSLKGLQLIDEVAMDNLNDLAGYSVRVVGPRSGITKITTGLRVSIVAYDVVPGNYENIDKSISIAVLHPALRPIDNIMRPRAGKLSSPRMGNCSVPLRVHAPIKGLHERSTGTRVLAR